jgi:hypothetical protein
MQREDQLGSEAREIGRPQCLRSRFILKMIGWVRLRSKDCVHVRACERPEPYMIGDVSLRGRIADRKGQEALSCMRFEPFGIAIRFRSSPAIFWDELDREMPTSPPVVITESLLG